MATEAGFRVPRTKQVIALEQPYGKVEPKTACAPELDKIRQAWYDHQAYKLIEFGWANCVWFREHAFIGDYPQSAWDSFLASKGVHEHLTVLDDQDQ